MDGLYAFSGASISVGTALGLMLRRQYQGRLSRNNFLALLLLLVTVVAPFKIPDGWFLFLSIVAQVPLVALAIYLVGWPARVS